MIRHHPAPELLADYSSGGMRLSHALCIASHLEYCSTCRQDVKKLTKLGTHLFEQFAEQPSLNAGDEKHEGLKANVLAQLDKHADQSHNSPKACAAGDRAGRRLPRSVQQFVNSGLDEIAWNSITPSIKVATLYRDKDGAQVALSRVRAGGQLPHHGHAGDEFTVVLEGSFSDDSGIFSKGDFIHRDKSHQHKPVVTKDAECICLMVLDAPIQFTGFLTRWFNPLVRRHHEKSACIR